MSSNPSSTPLELNGWNLRFHAPPPDVDHPELILMLHGWTGDETSTWVLARQIPDRYWLAAPRGIHPTPDRGYSWRPIQKAFMGSLAEFQPAAQRLLALVDQFAAHMGLAVPRFNVLGFSQGAAAALALALLYPERIHRAAALSGYLPAGLPAAPQDLAKVSFFISHGIQDDVIPVISAQQAVDTLKKWGASVVYCEDHSAHRLGLGCAKSLGAFFSTPAI
ncbi:MAG TPA: alpha/beta hydrolase-fold protein [Anaerolineaceae bacterium]|nr:alpha/beta hydrolase-fold protein [Anaerolineaceae bacterium]HPN50150.1 alpha/beta hydrolase-fold protein [Anaerolineaceae bacterium]